MSLSLHFGLANLLLKLSFELDLHGAHLTWAVFDSVRAEQEKKAEREQFYRPASATAPLGLDDRYRRAQA